MNTGKKLTIIASFFIIILICSMYIDQSNHIAFPKELTRIRCLEFDESTTDYTDPQTLDAVLNILQNSRFKKAHSTEPYIGNYMFEFYDDENVYYVGIARDQFIYNGERYIVDEKVNNEILSLLGK